MVKTRNLSTLEERRSTTAWLRGPFILKDEDGQPFTLDNGKHRGRKRTPEKNGLKLDDPDVIELVWRANDGCDAYSKANRKEFDDIKKHDKRYFNELPTIVIQVSI